MRAPWLTLLAVVLLGACADAGTTRPDADTSSTIVDSATAIGSAATSEPPSVAVATVPTTSASSANADPLPGELDAAVLTCSTMGPALTAETLAGDADVGEETIDGLRAREDSCTTASELATASGDTAIATATQDLATTAGVLAECIGEVPDDCREAADEHRDADERLALVLAARAAAVETLPGESATPADEQGGQDSPATGAGGLPATTPLVSLGADGCPGMLGICLGQSADDLPKLLGAEDLRSDVDESDGLRRTWLVEIDGSELALSVVTNRLNTVAELHLFAAGDTGSAELLPGVVLGSSTMAEAAAEVCDDPREDRQVVDEVLSVDWTCELGSEVAMPATLHYSTYEMRIAAREGRAPEPGYSFDMPVDDEPVLGFSLTREPTDGTDDRPTEPGQACREYRFNDDLPLRRCDTSPRVGDLQQALRDAGYDIVVDDLFGPGTESTVREYQADNGLAVDGIVGPSTWSSLTGG